jgi:hypothetical protein
MEGYAEYNFVLDKDQDEKEDGDYKKEYRNYHGKPKQKRERAARTAARELMKKKGRAKKGDGKDVDHKKPLSKGGTTVISNLRAKPAAANRSFKRNPDGSMK